ncbi:MAG: SH3 domain-containing protein [Caldilineaceae bacterium]|nr:SH3 domain-containing protein [Caldilineaceae bacterium]
MALSVTACGFRQSPSTAQEEYRPIRSPYPTFTPTPLNAPLTSDTAAGAEDGNAATAAPLDAEVPSTPTTALETAPAEAEPTETATTAEAPPTPTTAPTVAPPRLAVSAPLVNVRAGPGTQYAILSTVERGQEFDIVGKNGAGDWWRFCCINGEPAWVIDELVEATGAVDGVTVSDAVVDVPATATPLPVAAAPPTAAPAAPAEPTATEPPPAPAFSFELQNAEQFPENNVVRVFLYVFDSDQALAGYSVRVTKDGAELPVSQTSAGGQPSLTWPIADSRQRFQNMKVEFPGVAPNGTWQVQLVDGGGNVVGPPATFTLEGSAPAQELYVRYKKS